jgi:hypothetical protein
MTTLTIGKQFANAVADHISREMFPPHRGVIEVRNPFGGCRCLAAFGNDGYRQDARTRAYADALLAALADQGLWDAQLGIDSDEGYTWAILVPLDDDEAAMLFQAAIEDELYAQFREARGLADDDGLVLARKAVCDREISEHTDGEPLTISGWESVN